MSNPFNISFGEEPKNYIPRNNEINQVLESFNSDNPESKIYIFAGPRGSGKTVLLSHIKSIYEEKKDWITVDLNPYGDMLEQLCAKIYEKGKVKHLFLKTEFNFSFKGISFSISGENPISNVESMLERMFSYLLKKNIKVLMTIDDVSNNEFVKYFTHQYQSFIRDKYNVFLLLSGLYENISRIESDKSLTFLVRAPKIYMEKLDYIAITFSYMNLLGIEKEEAIKLSKLTMGYAYGYQLLGNLLYKNNLSLDDELMEKYDLALFDNVYSLIWKSLTKNEKNILIAIALDNIETDKILEYTRLNNSALQVYKISLSKAGLIDKSVRGTITLALPRFKEFILIQKEFE